MAKDLNFGLNQNSMKKRYSWFKIVLLAVVFFVQMDARAGKLAMPEVKSECLKIHHAWLKEAFFLSKNCVGFTAPVSGRAYSYISIGIYESNVEIIPELQSVTGQLDGYTRNVWQEKGADLNWQLVANSADFELLNYFFRNMPPSNSEHMRLVSDSIEKMSSKKCAKKMNERSIEYGKSIAMEIIEWSKLDGGDKAFDTNFPEEFEPPKCKSCWVKTAPGYLPSLLPFWGSNKQLMNESHLEVKDCEVFEFSIDSSSFMFQEAMGVLDNSKELDSKFENLAEYWDDGAGYSGTPTGHFFTIAHQLVVREGLKLDEALELYVKLGVAVNEAFISAFRLKYRFNFIRPITYIHRYIDPQFNTRIASPPFPEFPSGHSFQSGAATEVMKSIFTDSISITDSTNFNRTDIDGAPRTYSSLTEMSEEVSISRLYGGIHFKETLDVSLACGRKIGVFVVTELKCRK